MSSPVLTPIIERQERPKPEVIPEPTELLPIKRPNTEDFLTFLCFRGTPVLPPSLNFFSSSSEVESSAKSPESSKELNNGPIATTADPKSLGGNNEKPFIAFGVRKRADPIVISKQMDKKRRHALALQALRRKYQEQRLAKLRAITINSLSEKVHQKPAVRTTRSISKTDTVPKKDVIRKLKFKVVVPAPVIPPKRPIKQPLKPKVKPKMCLRSFSGRLTHHELKFKAVKKKPLLIKDKTVKKPVAKKKAEPSSDFSSDDDQPLVKTVKRIRTTNKPPVRNVIKRPPPKKSEITYVPMQIHTVVRKPN